MNWIAYILIGLCAGVIAGMGMGGGILLIPGLTLIMGVGQHAAQGVNTLAFIPAALAALAVHKKAGRLNIKLMLPLMLAGALAAGGGALIAGAISAPWLKRSFGAGLVLLADVRTVSMIVKRKKQKAETDK